MSRIPYTEATDLKVKESYIYINFVSSLADYRYRKNNLQDMFSITDVFTFIKEEQEKIMKASINSLISQYPNVKINYFTIPYDGSLRLHYSRSETETEYSRRKQQEELEYAQKLSKEEKQKIEDEKKLRKKYEQYKALKEYFDNNPYSEE